MEYQITATVRMVDEAAMACEPEGLLIPWAIAENRHMTIGAKVLYGFLLAVRSEQPLPLRRIAARLGIGERTAYRYLKELRANGRVVVRRNDNGRGNVYSLG